jgi:hypothetical protein
MLRLLAMPLRLQALKAKKRRRTTLPKQLLRLT